MTWELQGGATAGAPSPRTWGYITYEANDKGVVKPVRKVDDTLIAPGTGLWYISIMLSAVAAFAAVVFFGSSGA